MQEDLKKKLLALKVNVDKGIENLGDEYEEQLKKFINGYDFMRLGQAVNGGRFESAAMCVRRMSMEAERLGLDCFQRSFTGLRQNIARKDSLEVKNILSLVIIKRIQLQDALKSN